MPDRNLRVAFSERRYPTLSGHPYALMPAAVASSLLVATAGTVVVTAFYSPLTITLLGSDALGWLARFVKLDGVAVAGAVIGTLAALPLHAALERQGFTTLTRALLIGLLSFAIFIPLAVVEAAIFRAPPAYWLLLALPAAVLGFFSTLLFARFRRAPRTSKVLAWVAAALVIGAAMMWVLLPGV